MADRPSRDGRGGRSHRGVTSRSLNRSMGHVETRADVRRPMAKLLAATLTVIAGCATEIPPPVPTQPPTALVLSATGLGPCKVQWYFSCNYGIRIQGPGGYDHRGNFAWDEGRPSPGPEPAHGPNGPVSSTGIWGDVPATLPPGDWTISFRLWYGSDLIDLVPVPSGTPRTCEEDPFVAACSTEVNTVGVARVSLHVAFRVSACTVEIEAAPSSTERAGTST